MATPASIPLKVLVFVLVSLLYVSCNNQTGESGSTPADKETLFESPTGRPLSLAMKRALTIYPDIDDGNNEFFSNFKYSPITGIGKGDGVSRRDPSKVIRVNGKYYVWYTRRDTESIPVGMEDATDEIPAVDWDLAEIWYATSKNGFEWEEQGVAVPRNKKGEYGDRAATTTDILVHEGKYYLYYQTFTGPFSSTKGDYCDVSMAWADSPDGPWTRINNPVIPLGGRDAWDEGAIHDPYPLVYKGKIWLFYKGQPRLNGENNWLVRAQGVSIADHPLGTYEKHEMNPLINSGHETCLFPWEEGLAAIVTFDGPEKNTIQYARDGINFKVMASIQSPPIAPGPYIADAFDDNGDGKGIRWGLCHMNNMVLAPPENYRRLICTGSFLARFDCDLHREVDLPYFKNPRDQNGRFQEETYFHPKRILEEHVKKEILEEMK